MKGLRYMYNVKISEYLDSTEVVFYSSPIFGHEKEKDTFLIERNDELFEMYSYMAFGTKLEKEEKEKNSLHAFYVSFNRTKNKIYNYARANCWEWFVTFTFNPQKVDSFNYDEVVNCMSSFLWYMKRTSKTDLQYLIVPEKHKSGRFHLHGIFSNIDMSIWKFTFSHHFTKTGIPIYNIAGFPYGFSTATQVQDTVRVSHYIAKYITKDMFSAIKNRKRYWSTHNISSGVHTTLFLTESELEILLNSFGECQYLKTIDTPYNNIRYYQF